MSKQKINNPDGYIKTGFKFSLNNLMQVIPKTKIFKYSMIPTNI